MNIHDANYSWRKLFMALVDSVTANAVGEGEEREGGRGVQKEGAEESRTSTKVCESMHTI